MPGAPERRVPRILPNPHGQIVGIVVSDAGNRSIWSLEEHRLNMQSSLYTADTEVGGK